MLKATVRTGRWFALTVVQDGWTVYFLCGPVLDRVKRYPTSRDAYLAVFEIAAKWDVKLERV